MTIIFDSTPRFRGTDAMTKTSFLLAATALSASSPAFADDAALQAEVGALKAQVAAQAAQIAQMEAQLKAARVQASAVPPAAGSQTTSVAAAIENDKSESVLGPKTTFGGYGEIAYNGYVHDGSRNQVDLKRFVLFFGHRFNDKLSFNSEVEWEH